MEMKQQEVEVRVIISDKQKDFLLKRLKELDAELLDIEHLEDYYYCPKNVKSFKEIEMDKVGSYSLRLRKVQTKSHPEKIELNMKVITTEGDHNSWQEHEVQVNSFREIEDILKSLGYKVYFNFQKLRTTFKINDMSILIEDINNFQPILEIEKITTLSNGDKAKKEILAQLKNLGISSYDVVPKSVTNILMKKWSKF